MTDASPNNRIHTNRRPALDSIAPDYSDAGFAASARSEAVGDP